MSAQSAQALVQAYSQLLVEDYAIVAVSCKYILRLVVYEFLITTSDEADILWKRPVTTSAILLGSVRWCMLLTVALQLAPPTRMSGLLTQHVAYWNSTHSCKTLSVLDVVITLTGFIQTALFSSLRVFAIWRRSYVWSLPVFALSMVPVVTNLIYTAMSKYISVAVPLVGMTCISESPFSGQTTYVPQARRSVLYITRVSLILADTMVLILTWIKTFGHWRHARSVGVKVSMTTCLLRDGTIYFIILLAMNLAQLLTFDSSGDLAPMGTFATTLPPVLVNRFMINLRTVDSEVPDYSVSTNDQQQRTPTLQFTRSANRLGNIGATLQDGWSEDEAWDEEDSAAGVEEAGQQEASAEA
ncbi:uncharacterized protein PHACADRAFT_206490 [Phanerochaete carnosa HHB-10118-sp]|uniref:Uncharacterized protein n=1 Tax=Phanerochaete carnosa (strain HHB-10118-sp) TaxID=650164 RepID=K5X435_PHACS|nr:uncharacterized protein PHACADRAFT_206490 [Phanerochaete carnosa HHB-10118-sp]EKM57597.1 hypothetical protein PHACADRAFT_206490 [Phanerochaete carnosa HHB-10118-sp]